MAKQHPITPPPELVQQWMREAHDQPPGPDVRVIATQAAQWGWNQRGAINEAELQKARDEELKACLEAIKQIWAMEHVATEHDLMRELRALRRPKPPSLKERIAAAIAAGDQDIALSLSNEALPNG